MGARRKAKWRRWSAGESVLLSISAEGWPPAAPFRDLREPVLRNPGALSENEGTSLADDSRSFATVGAVGGLPPHFDERRKE
jgi:hypothetical protein